MTAEEMTLDHVIPRAFGGSNRIENLRLAHVSCNERRGCDFFGLSPLPTSRPNQFAELFKELCGTNA
jgi:5-methylcytosine-specific restriction endonuclease McrA